MQYSNYPFIMDISSTGFGFAGYAVHFIFIVLQAGLAGFLLVSGILSLINVNKWPKILYHFGLISNVPEVKRVPYGGVNLCLGFFLLFPLIAGASYVVSFVTCILALILFIYIENKIPTKFKKPGIIMRHAMMLVSLVCTLFIFYERADSLDLGVDIMLKALKYRNQEVSWQLESDRLSPKVGDLAPDFQLLDTIGTQSVRLSDFRNKKPVILIFGSHT